MNHIGTKICLGKLGFQKKWSGQAPLKNISLQVSNNIFVEYNYFTQHFEY